jgi:hypothetical protein
VRFIAALSLEPEILAWLTFYDNERMMWSSKDML